MQSYTAGDFQIELDAPVEVGRAAGHFWFSTIHPFTSDDLICEVVRSADKAQGKWPASLFLSHDSGRSWSHALDIDSYGPASVRVSDSDLFLMPYETWPLKEGDARNARADGTLVSLKDGALNAARARVEFLGFPRDLAEYHQGELNLVTNGNMVDLEAGRLLSTFYGRYAGEEKYTLWCMTSDDGGTTWKYLSEVASWKDVPEAREGPDESNSVRLADGRLMCVYRVESGKGGLYHRSFSSDEGASWTSPQPIAGAWSVEPRLDIMGEGNVALTGGRPGLYLWLSDPGAENWQQVNLAQHHNASLANKEEWFCQEFVDGESAGKPSQSTSYTGFRSVGPDEAIVSYDWLGNGWEEAPGPWGQESVVYTVRVRLRPGS